MFANNFNLLKDHSFEEDNPVWKEETKEAWKYSRQTLFAGTLLALQIFWVFRPHTKTKFRSRSRAQLSQI